MIPFAEWISYRPLEPKVKKWIKAVKLLHPDHSFTALCRAGGMFWSSIWLNAGHWWSRAQAGAEDFNYVALTKAQGRLMPWPTFKASDLKTEQTSSPQFSCGAAVLLPAARS